MTEPGFGRWALGVSQEEGFPFCCKPFPFGEAACLCQGSGALIPHPPSKPTPSKPVGFPLRAAQPVAPPLWPQQHPGTPLAAHLPGPCRERMSWEEVGLWHWHFLQICHLQWTMPPWAGLDLPEILENLTEQSDTLRVHPD